MKCRRYIRELGRKCGEPAAKYYVRKNLIGVFCHECYLITIRDSVGPEQLLGPRYRELNYVMRGQAREIIRSECEKRLSECATREEY